MFDDEEDDFLDGNLSEDVDRFEQFLNGGEIGFFDSDRLEAVLDHFLMNGQYSKASAVADYALDLYAYNPLFLLRKAQAISAMGQLKEGLALLTQAEKLETPNCEFYLTKASIFSQLRDSKTAIKYFKEALQLAEPEDRDEIFLDLAMEYENANDYKRAVKILQEAIRYNPSNEGAIYEMAFCYDQLGEYEQAIKSYSDYIDENPYSFTAWYNLGNAYSKMEEHDKAIWAYDYCVVINEEFGPVYFNLGNAYMSKEQFQNAIQSFSKSMELDGEDPVALCYIGEAYEQLGDLGLARGYYQQSLELAPMLPDAWLGLGIIEDLEGRTKEALVLLHKAAELDPENSGVYHVLAGAYEKLEDFVQAMDYYQLSLALDPTDEECLTSFMQLYVSLSPIEALAYIQDFNEKIQENELGLVLEVNTLILLGRKTEALELFKVCLEVDREKAKELFDINPELNNVQEFVHLAAD